MKKLLIIGAVLLAAAAVTTALILNAWSGEDDRSIKIGVSIYLGEDTFISTVMNDLQKILGEYDLQEEKDYARVYLSIADAKGSQNLQNEQVDRFLSLDYNVLIVNPVDRTHTATIIDKAMEKDVPIIFFNREPVEADMMRWDRLYYVGTDAPKNGELEGEIVVEAYQQDSSSLDKNGDGVITYIMLEGEFRHQDAVLRTEGSVQTIKDAGITLEKLDGGVANWDRNQAAALARRYFEQYGDGIELFICNNDDMALGVVDVVSELGLDFVNIVGIDGTPQGLEALAEGKMLGTVVIDAYAHADSIFRLSLALCNTSGAPDLDEIAAVVKGREDTPAYVDEPRTIRVGMYILRQEDLLVETE